MGLRRRRLLIGISTAATSTTAGCTDPFATGTDDESASDANGGSDGEAAPEEPDTPTEAATLFVEDLAADRIETAHGRLASLAKNQIALGQLEQIWMGYTAVGGDFRGIVDTAETVESGYDAVDVTMEFDRATDVLRVLVDENLGVVGLYFNGDYERPDYVDPDAFESTDVTLESGDCSLPGAITTPTAADDATGAPGVVLVHGSGPADMNLQNVATRAFQDLAEGLATKDIASLRYDKRTYACDVDPTEHTLDRVAVDDALEAIDELRSVEGVDEDRIVVVGLSMGGLAVPRIVERDGALAGGAALAAPARPFHELVVDQLEHQATVGDYEWEQRTALYEQWSDQIDRIRAGDYAADDNVLGYPGALWQSLEAYDHVRTARETDEPLLFLQGERDFQVTVEGDLERWRDELGDRPETAFETYDGLNHLFMPGEGTSVPFEYSVRNNVEGRVVDDLAAWIEQR